MSVLRCAVVESLWAIKARVNGKVKTFFVQADGQANAVREAKKECRENARFSVVDIECIKAGD